MNHKKSEYNQLQKTGRTGENIASRFLQKKGYQIIDRNFRARYGELDIVALKDNILTAVEVKTRYGDSFGLPEESVTPRKLQEVIKTFQYYCQTHPKLPKDLRIDVIGIMLDENGQVIYLNHVENVTM